jgi:hypothetical protein
VKLIVYSIFSAFIVLIGISYFNYNQLKVSSKEIAELNKCFESIIINDSVDLIKIQNNVVDKIKHGFVSTDHINIINNLHLKRGQCFERSIILQKILIFNRIKIRPVYVYFRSGQNNTRFTDIISAKLNSHSIFEFNYNGNWYVMKTNTKMSSFYTLDEYINKGVYVPVHAKFIRHLSNRNGRFIYPSFIPDIY